MGRGVRRASGGLRRPVKRSARQRFRRGGAFGLVADVVPVGDFIGGEFEVPRQQVPRGTRQAVGDIVVVAQGGDRFRQLAHFGRLDLGRVRQARFGERPKPAELAAMAEAWRPWRGVAARLLWAYYALLKRREGINA